jgi:hypothetical protein
MNNMSGSVWTLYESTIRKKKYYTFVDENEIVVYHATRATHSIWGHTDIFEGDSDIRAVITRKIFAVMPAFIISVHTHRDTKVVIKRDFDVRKFSFTVSDLGLTLIGEPSENLTDGLKPPVYYPPEKGAFAYHYTLFNAYNEVLMTFRPINDDSDKKYAITLYAKDSPLLYLCFILTIDFEINEFFKSNSLI